MFAYTLRPYKKSDFEFVYQVKKEAYKKYVEEFWGAWDEDKQRVFFDDFMKKVQNFLQIIEVENTPIGIYHGNRIGQDTYELGNLILIPEYQRKGIGKDLLSNIIQTHSKLKIHLQVFKSNPAIHLYKRLGFEMIDETRTHFIMERK